ncbi:MAG TPA: tyrosine-type recombinase/integrase [Kribbella sp.]|jgi:integrase
MTRFQAIWVVQSASTIGYLGALGQRSSAVLKNLQFTGYGWGFRHPQRPGRRLDTDGHIPRDWFRKQVWDPAVRAAGIGRRVRVRDLRHAHASWVLAGGADLQIVRERLGHAGLRATERYLHTLPDADDTALSALARTRAGTCTAAVS